jgi:transposase-like protein
MQSIWMVATRADAHTAFDRFVSFYAARYPKTTETLKKDRESLLAFYECPAEHWQHLRTTNAIESTFATVRHRTCVHAQLRIATNLAGARIQADRRSRENLAPYQRPGKDRAVARGRCLQGRRTGARRSADSAEIRRLKSIAIKKFISG